MLGRIVHFVQQDGPALVHTAAIIVKVAPPFVNLHVHEPDYPGISFHIATEDQTATKPNTWHWPEREEVKA